MWYHYIIRINGNKSAECGTVWANDRMEAINEILGSFQDVVIDLIHSSPHANPRYN